MKERVIIDSNITVCVVIYRIKISRDYKIHLS